MADLKVIGLSGGAGVGKDFIANLLMVQYGFLPLGLADEMKIRLIAEGKATFEECFITKPPHVRTMLQQVGTEQGRDVFGEDYWCEHLIAEMRSLAFRWGGPGTRFVVTDVRFPNEVLAVQRIGGTVLRIIAPTRQLKNALTPEQRQHLSETALDHFKGFDGCVHNDLGDEGSVAGQVWGHLNAHGLVAALADDRIRTGV